MPEAIGRRKFGASSATSARLPTIPSNHSSSVLDLLSGRLPPAFHSPTTSPRYCWPLLSSTGRSCAPSRRPPLFPGPHRESVRFKKSEKCHLVFGHPLC